MVVNLTKVHFQLHNVYYYYSYKTDGFFCFSQLWIFVNVNVLVSRLAVLGDSSDQAGKLKVFQDNCKISFGYLHLKD